MKEAGLTSIFHPWKLHLAPSSPFPGQILEPDPPIVVSSSDGKAHDEWEVLEVVDLRQTKRYGLQYKATYMGNWDEWNANPPWQPCGNFENAAEKVVSSTELIHRSQDQHSNWLNKMIWSIAGSYLAIFLGLQRNTVEYVSYTGLTHRINNQQAKLAIQDSLDDSIASSATWNA